MLTSIGQDAAATPVTDLAPSRLPPPRPGRHDRQASKPLARRRATLAGYAQKLAVLTALALLLAAAVSYGGRWVPVRYSIYLTWVLPLLELGMLALGQLNFRFRFRVAAPGQFTELIIQITTTGKEQERVNEIIEQVHSYELEMDYVVWVVTEPGQGDRYPFADVVLTVPPDFTAQSEKKARALEYSRRVRAYYELDRPDVKILFNDDDVSLTRSYIEAAFAADYDICEGVVTPRTEYGLRPLNHFLTSHADDIRTHACLVYCSVFQGIVGRPLHVHGEGLTVTGAVERAVTWDWPAFASEDLVFGQRAARAGFRWGWFHEYAEVTSPWSFRDFLTQRSRWLWGDIHAITHRDVLPLRAALVAALKYVVGVIILVLSASGVYLRLTGRIPDAPSMATAAKLSVVAWIAVFFACGWIGASSSAAPRSHDSRLLSAVMSVLALPISVTLTFAAIIVPLLQGNPRTFKVIRKTRRSR